MNNVKGKRGDPLSKRYYDPSIKRIQSDLRIGGIRRFVYASDREIMRIHDDIRKCVAFLAVNRNGGMRLCATVFFVAHPIEGTDQWTVYAVTARHVIEEITKRAIDGMCHFRLNHKQTGSTFVEYPLSEWVYATDEKIDVAIAPFDIDGAEFDHRPLSLEAFLSDDKLHAERVGQGDDLFFPGMFVSRPGEQVNIPILRTGTIAAMPGEPIKTKWGSVRSAYLVEARSIGGLSGSPVFLYIAPTRDSWEGILMRSAEFHLLGLVHGHYKANHDTTAFDFTDDADEDFGNEHSINAGIAIVVPVADIRSVLNNPTLVGYREELRKQAAANEENNLPVPD